MNRRLLAAGLVFALPMAFAVAQDKSVLNDRDDVEFARALVANGYPDLAERLLLVFEKSGSKKADQAKSQIAAIKLDVAQDAALKIDDPIKRKDALVKLLAEKEKFVEDYKGTEAAEDVRNALPDLYDLIGQTITAAIKKTTDDKVLTALRTEGDGIFKKAEQAMKQRIIDIKGIEERTDVDEVKLARARYNFPRTMYFHSLLFAPGSSERKALCTEAIKEFDEFFLDYEGGDDLLPFFANIEYGLCLKETGVPDDALRSFDKTIDLRGTWGPKTDKGFWPIPAGSEDIVDLVCYALLHKAMLLGDQKKFDEVVKLGKEYFASIPKPFGPPSSMNLAKELCEAQIAIGDKGAAATAKAMNDEDPNGLGGFLARDLIEKMGGAVGVPYTDKLKTAESKIAAKDYDRAIAIARQVLFETAATPDEAKAGCQTWLLIGWAYQARGWHEEAALAFETGVNKFPKAEAAAECLSRAIAMYTTANRSRRKILKDRVEALTNQLVRDYPNAPQSADIQMQKALALEKDEDYEAAIEIYKKVEKASNNYTKSRVMIGIDSFNMIIKRAREADEAEKAKKPDEAKLKKDDAKNWYGVTEGALKDAITTIQAHPPTMDQTVLKAYDDQEYYATLSLAKLYMMDGYGRAADATPIIDKLEAKWGSDPKKGPDIQNLRGKLFLSQGKLEEAAKWVDELVKRDPKAAAGPAGQVARAFDAAGQAKFDAQPGSLEGDQLWVRAARYYWISIEPQVNGTVSQNVDEMTDLGNRFYVYGLHFNGIPKPKTPDERTTFVDWVPGAKRSPDPWTKAARIYEAALAQNPSYRMTINLGRTYGFLGNWVEAARVYSKLFEQEQIVDQKAKNRLDRTAMSAKPELVMAYIEWGVAERLAANNGTDKERLARAMTIMTLLHNTLKPDALVNEYWAAQYNLVRTLIDRGDYKDAKASIDDVTRNVSPTFDDGKYGYKQRFLDAIEELKKK